jgi:hypothetical protein
MVAYLASVPKGATGFSNFPGGAAIVGEQGPELVNLPRGSDVYPTGTGPAAGGVTFAPGAVVVQVSGLLDPRTIRELSTGVSDEIMRKAKLSRTFGG